MNRILSLNRSDLNSIKTLLGQFDLPDSDLETAPIHFFGIRENKVLIVTGAIELYNTNAILRSVAVHPKYQNSGYGKQITNFLEIKAAELKVQKLFLLTTTAEEFFKKFDYQIIDREFCPDEIKASAQFTELCPSTAICLFKNLKPSV